MTNLQRLDGQDIKSGEFNQQNGDAPGSLLEIESPEKALPAGLFSFMNMISKNKKKFIDDAKATASLTNLDDETTQEASSAPMRPKIALGLGGKGLMAIIKEKADDVKTPRTNRTDLDGFPSPRHTDRNKEPKIPERTAAFWDRWEDEDAAEVQREEDKEFVMGLFEPYDNPFDDKSGFLAQHPSVLYEGQRFESFMEKSQDRSRSVLDASVMSKKSGKSGISHRSGKDKSLSTSIILHNK
jgi:hypothetical protein